MPRCMINWNFGGDEHSEIVECDAIDEAEWIASDRLREVIYLRTSSSAEPLAIENSK